MTPIVIITFLLLASLLLYIIILAKGFWLIKIPIILLTVYFGILLYIATYSYLGWAASDNLPNKFELLGSKVNEPDTIYITLIDVSEDKKKTSLFTWLGYKSSRNEPRLYKTKYQRNLHEILNKGEQLISEGHRVIIEYGNIKGDGEDKDLNPGDGARQGTDTDEGAFMLYVLPPVDLGTKD